MVHSITLQTYDGTITDNDILGQICFAAPNEHAFAAGAVTASIFARSETGFDDDENETELVFATASGGATGARPTASLTGDMILSSAGLLTVAGGITSTAASNTLGATSFNDANITNVGNIALDSISADGSTITITGNTTFADGAYDFDIASHDTSNGLKLGGALVTATAAELNLLDGSSAGTVANSKAVIYSAAGIVQATDLKVPDGGGIHGGTVSDFIVIGSDTVTIKDGAYDFDIASHDTSNGLKLGGTLVTATAAELNYLDISTLGTAATSKAVTVSAGGKITLGSIEIEGSAFDIDGGTIDGATIATSDITVGSSKTLNVSGGTLTTSAAQNLAIVQGAASNIDIGAYELRAQTLESDVATGTAPLTVASTTKVTNLNADKLDDQEGSYYLDFSNFVVDADEISGDKIHGGTISGNVALGDGATATTQPSSDNSTKIATTAYVDAASGGGSGDITGVDLTGGTGIDIGSETNTTSGDYSATISVDVSDFMTSGANNRVLTAVDADSFQGESNLTFGGGDLLVGGSTPSITIGDAGSEDVKLVFDHASQDYYLGVDHSESEKFMIGLGSAVGTTPVITMTSSGALSVGVDDTGYDFKIFGATSGKYMEWDESGDRLQVFGSYRNEMGNATNGPAVAYNGTVALADGGATIDIDWSKSNYHWVRLGQNVDVTKITFTNMFRGGRYILRIEQNNVSASDVSWETVEGGNSSTAAFTEVRWVGGDAPTMSTGTSSTDVYGFLCTRSNGRGMDCFVIAQDLQEDDHH